MFVRIVLMVLIAVLPVVSYAATGFPDTQDHSLRSYIEYLQDADVVQGNPDGNFYPERTVNRAEFLKMLLLSADVTLSIQDTNGCFTDFYGQTQWFWPYACNAKKLGFVDGYPSGEFGGERTVNLAEAIKMTLEVWGTPLPQYIRAPDHWYDPYVDAASGLQVFDVLPRIPGALLTRAQAATLISMVHPNFASRPQASSSSTASTAVCGNGILESNEQCDDGNTQNDDGCSKACIVVTQPVYHGALRIEQQANGTLQTAAGTPDVLLLTFDAIAGRQSVFITQVQFTSDVGSLESATNYRLYYDSNNDGAVDTLLGTAVPQNEQLAFADMQIPVPEGYMVRVELRADVQKTGNPGSFSVKFATSEPEYIAGVDAVDGRDVVGIETDNAPCATVSICWIAVYTQSARLISLGGTPGSVYVTKSTTPVRSRQILLGEQSSVLARLQFRAVQEDISIQTVQIGGGNASIDSLQLYFAGATTPFATATSAACAPVLVGQYCTTKDFTVKKDTDVQVLVRALLRKDTNGGTSGSTAALSLSASTVGSTVAVTAEGMATLSLLQQNNGNTTEEGEVFIGRTTPGVNIPIVGPTHDVVAAKIQSITNSHPDPDNSAIPLGLSNFATFRLQAANHANTMNGSNAVAIEDITLNVTATNIEFSASSIEIFNPANSSVAVPCSQSATTGVISVTCTNLDTGVLQAFIASGEAIELSLRGNITNSQLQPGTSTLQATLQGLGTRNSGPIRWNDEVATWLWVDAEESTVRSTIYRNQ